MVKRKRVGLGVPSRHQIESIQQWTAIRVDRRVKVPNEKTRSAYNRAMYLDQRRAMLEAWAGWLGDSR